MSQYDSEELYGGVPLGGIGTGSVELRADGSFNQWQIFNNWGNKEKLVIWEHHPSYNLPDNFFIIHCDDGQRKISRVLQKNPLPGLDGIENIDYKGQFPFAGLTYTDAELPLDISLEAFSPFIPHDSKNSGQPGAFFKLKVGNNSGGSAKVAFAFSLHNPFGKQCIPGSSDGLAWLEINAGKKALGALPVSGMASGFLGRNGELTYSKADDPSAVFSYLDENGRLEEDFTGAAPDKWSGDHGAVCINTDARAGEQKEFIFVLSWFFPEHHENGTGVYVGHQYENWHASAKDVLFYFQKNLSYLVEKTHRWHEAMYFGSSPHWLKDLIANSAYLFSKTSWWVKDGRFSFYESFHCPTIDPIHVRDAASSMVTMLFPELEKGVIRRFARHQIANGKIPELFYAFQGKELTLQGLSAEGEEVKGGASVTYAAGRNLFDNETKYVLQLYRDFLWTGDRAFLEELYVSAKKAIEYEAARDSDGDGLPDGVFSATSNDFMSLGYLPSYNTVIWLAGLKALEKMAVAMADTECVEYCASLFEKGRASAEEKLWNGEFYASCCDDNGEQLNVCFADQIYGQFFGGLLKLGHLLDPERIRMSIDAIFRYNAQDTRFGLTNIVVPGRGRYITADSRAGQGIQPSVNFTFLILALYEGREPGEVLEVLKRIYDNYVNGMPGSLWSTPDYLNADTGKPHRAFFGYYLRAAAIWNMLWAIEGFYFDGVEKCVTIKPIGGQTEVEGPFVTPHCWGTFFFAGREEREVLKISPDHGQLQLERIELPLSLKKQTGLNITLKNNACDYRIVDDEILLTFSPSLSVRENEVLDLEIT